jgi:hypothetical protein
MHRKKIIKAMEMHNFHEDIKCEFEQIEETVKSFNGRKRKFAEKMDELLTEEQRLLVWEYSGMCTGGKTGEQAKKFAKELTGSLAEKIARLNEGPHFFFFYLNGDGTITAYCGCHCLQYRIEQPEKNEVKTKTPSTYGCAAGAAFQNIKKALGIEARIKSIDYPQEGDGKKYMTFVIEVIE